MTSPHAATDARATRRTRSRTKSRATRAGLIAGLGATLVALGLWRVGALDAMEGFLVDQRFIHATRSAPPITNRIVHLDIDKASIDKEGRWPWNREKLALVIDALHEAGAKAIVLDLLLSDPQEQRRTLRTGEIVDDDALLAAAFARAGTVVLGVNIAPENDPASETDGEDEVQAPVPALGEAVARIGFVNVREKGARAVRTVPATETIRGERHLQLGVAAAALAEGIDPDTIRVEGDTLIFGDQRLLMRNGRILVPWHVRRDFRDGPASWVRGTPSKWITIHRHVPIHPMLQYERDVQRAVRILTGRDRSGPVSDAEFAEAKDNAAFIASTLETDDLPGRYREIETQWQTATTPEDRANLEIELDTLEAIMALPTLEAVRSPEGLTGEFGGEALTLDWFKDKVVFIGWQSSGAIADFYPTAMDVRTPGVTVHAAVASGILSGHWKVSAPPWADALAILALGVIATLIAVATPVHVGVGLVALLALAYAALNGLVVFDRFGIALHAAGPLMAIGMAWATCTAVRAIQEAREKGAIRRQFRSRVSAQLVDYLASNPDLMNMEGEEREVTTMFTDFVGFTSISEKLEGPATVKLLNTYMSRITDVLLHEGAYVNKFLGDGIMAFWGAPVEQNDHAARGCRAAIAAIETLERVNAMPEYADLPKLGMRLGLSTGKVIVGDCGAPPKLNDYTVIGDAVNLAARLESANKMLGTRVLLTARTREMMDPEERDALAWRPIGLIRVVGQTKPSDIWELLGPRAMLDNDADMRQWVSDTENAVNLFHAGEYAESLTLWQDLVLYERGSGGALLYVERCAELLESGQIDSALPLRSK